MPSAVARRGFLVEGAEAAFLVGTILSGLAVGFGGRCSSTAGGPSSHRMIASRPGWSCFFSPAVSSASTSQAWPIAVQSSWPLRSGGDLR